jgi:hypothetical protein
MTIADSRPLLTTKIWSSGRYASGEPALKTAISNDLGDLEAHSSFTSAALSLEKAKAYNPVKRAQDRSRELPPSRYVSMASTRFQYVSSLELQALDNMKKCLP